ncbi:hypothetical protein G7Y89_g4441 [Cudoniella acicularis]|uniref:Cutinase n=1 Tax=Cudoniella acicularis TaxID=354080 RepID=A0A8H4W4A3_9HELO|nr:hypothetical protein G7Y89_g4441 [Cudoniella acicularis]
MRFSLIAVVSLLGLALASPVPEPSLALRRDASAPIEKRETALNAFLTLLLDYLPDIDGSINSVVGVLTVFERLLALLTGEQTTYNGLGGTCTTYTVIFARGTSEPGNVGILVGPPFFDALKSVVGSSAVTIQGVNDYAASVEGYLEGGDPTGSAEMATQIKAAKAACPNTKLIVSGYSQGGQIVHNAAALLPAATAEWISKVVIFGDPDNGKPVTNVASANVKIFCSAADNICVNGDLILPAHLLGPALSSETNLFRSQLLDNNSFLRVLRDSKVMDPFSIAASVGTLSHVCLVTVRRLGELAGKFKAASKILQDVSSETKIITISLSQLQNILVKNDNTILAEALLTLDVRNALDTALTGCSVTLSCIESEIRSLTTNIDIDQKLNLADRAKIVWKEDKFKELLQQLRGQHNTISILQQGLQMKAIADIIPLLKINCDAIKKVADGTESLRGLYPQVNKAESFMASIASPNRDETTFSIISERQFEFDDVVRNSTPYQRANQARKISGAPLRTAGSSAPEKASSPGNVQRTSRGNSGDFFEQLHVHVDGVEGENMSLREEMQEKDALIHNLEAQIIQTWEEEAERVQRQIKEAEAEYYERARRDLETELADMEYTWRAKIEKSEEYWRTLMAVKLDETRKEGDLRFQEMEFTWRNKHEETILLYQERAEREKDLSNKISGKLDAIQKEKDSLKKRLTSTHRRLDIAIEDEVLLYENLDAVQDSIQNGKAAKIGSTILVPLQSLLPLKDSLKRPPIFEAVKESEMPEDWVQKWKDEKLATMSSLDLETPKHNSQKRSPTPTSSLARSTDGPSNKSPTVSPKTPAPDSPSTRIDMPFVAGPSNKSPVVSPTAPAPDSPSSRIDKPFVAETSNQTRRTVTPPVPNFFRKEKKNTSISNQSPGRPNPTRRGPNPVHPPMNSTARVRCLSYHGLASNLD